MTTPRRTALLLAVLLLPATIGLGGCKPSVGRMVTRSVLTKEAQERARERFRPGVRPGARSRSGSDSRVQRRHRAVRSRAARRGQRSR